MTVTLAPWAIPAALTILIWSSGFILPTPRRRSDYDLDGAFDALLFLAGATITTLIVWLIFFALT